MKILKAGIQWLNTNSNKFKLKLLIKRIRGSSINPPKLNQQVFIVYIIIKIRISETKYADIVKKSTILDRKSSNHANVREHNNIFMKM